MYNFRLLSLIIYKDTIAIHYVEQITLSHQPKKTSGNSSNVGYHFIEKNLIAFYTCIFCLIKFEYWIKVFGISSHFVAFDFTVFCRQDNKTAKKVLSSLSVQHSILWYHFHPLSVWHITVRYSVRPSVRHPVKIFVTRLASPEQILIKFFWNLAGLSLYIAVFKWPHQLLT